MGMDTITHKLSVSLRAVNLGNITSTLGWLCEFARTQQIDPNQWIATLESRHTTPVVHRIDKDETAALKRLATHLLALTPQALKAALLAGELMEINCNAQNQISHS